MRARDTPKERIQPSYGDTGETSLESRVDNNTNLLIGLHSQRVDFNKGFNGDFNGLDW